MNQIELRDIPGCEGYYQASSDGHIWSIRSKKFLKEAGGDDYHMVTLLVKGKYKCEYVHRLVAMAFIPNPDPEKYTDVNHMDEVKYHNYPNNLEWCTRKYNLHYSDVWGGKGCGTRKAVYCVELNKSFASMNEAAKATGIQQSNLSALLRRGDVEKNTLGGYHWRYAD